VGQTHGERLQALQQKCRALTRLQDYELLRRVRLDYRTLGRLRYQGVDRSEIILCPLHMAV
jgi:hypothetical protein